MHGTTHRQSDTDVAMLMRQRLSAGARFDVQERMAARLGRDVDVVDLAAASPVLAIQIVAARQLLHAFFSCRP